MTNTSTHDTEIVLVIDDLYDQEKFLADRLPKAMAEALGANWNERFQLCGARDFFDAEEKLAADWRKVRLVLLDQFFEHRDCRLLDENLQPTKNHPPVLCHDQGFYIARRIAKDLGALRPPIFIFTSKGQDVSTIDELLEQEIVAAYHGKPSSYEKGVVEFDALVSFLRRWLNPVAFLHTEGAIQGIDGIMVRFLESRLPGWRRHTPAILEALAHTARTHTEGIVNQRAWSLATRRQLLPDLRQAWNDNDLWRSLLRPWGKCEVWQPWRKGENALSTGRMRFFKVENGPARGTRVLAIVDPLAVSDGRSESEWRNLTNLSPLESMETGFKPYRKLFRLDLPPQAPGSSLPFLVGTYFDVSKGGDWIPLAMLRQQQIDAQHPLRQRFAEVCAAIRKLAENDGDRPPPGWGAIADSVLINPTADKSDESWRVVWLPVRDLGLSPDPYQARLPPHEYLRRLASRADWLRILAFWFAWGRLPNLPHKSELRELWNHITQLAEGGVAVLNPRDWHHIEDEPRETHADAKADAPFHVQRRTVNFPSVSRLLANPETENAARRSLEAKNEKINLVDCTLQVESRQDTVVPLYEQIHFRGALELHRCRVVGSDGQPAPIVIRHCTFENGCTIDEVECQDIIVKDCQFLGDRPLKLLGCKGNELRLEKVVGTIEGHTLEFVETKVELGAHGRLNLVRGTFSGPAWYKGAESTTAQLRDCHFQADVSAAGNLLLTLNNCRLQQSLVVRDTLGALTMEDVVVAGDVQVARARIAGAFTLRRVTVERVVRGEQGTFGAFSMFATNCVGAFLFAGATFDGPVCIAQAHEDTANAGNREELAGAVFRDQLDFTRAQFRAPVDLSHVVIEHEAKFQGAEFHDADFRRLQATGNLVFADTRFAGSARFDQMIVAGVFDASRAHFAQAPRFTGASFGAAARFRATRWPTTQPNELQVDFTDVLVQGALDLADPRDAQDQPNQGFTANLVGANAGRLYLDFTAMRNALALAEKNLSQVRTDDARQRVVALARTLEATLAKEVKFDQADVFYRDAQRLGGAGSFFNWVWGYGTLPWRAFFWLLVVASLMVLVAKVFGNEEFSIQMAREAVGRAMLGESPTMVLTSYWGDIFLLVLLCIQALLLNLFFASLARKLLR